MSFQRLQSVTGFFIPLMGWAVVEGTTTFDQDGRATEFYSVRLARDSRLTVPVDRAEALGLRLIVNAWRPSWPACVPLYTRFPAMTVSGSSGSRPAGVLHSRKPWLRGYAI